MGLLGSGELALPGLDGPRAPGSSCAGNGSRHSCQEGVGFFGRCFPATFIKEFAHTQEKGNQELWFPQVKSFKQRFLVLVFKWGER